MTELRFVVHGSIASANRIRAPHEGRMRKTKEARDTASRVREVATVAAAGWTAPQAACVTIIAYNSRIDADNVSKAILDAMKGIAWRDDADVMDISVSRRWDGDGERYEVSVMESIDYRPSAGKRKKIADPFVPGQVLTFEQRDALLRKVGIR